MKARISYQNAAPATRAMFGLETYLTSSTIDKNLQHLIKYRVSQINGCAFCLDMHSKDLLHEGEDVQRLLVLDAWREAPFYSDKERAALEWAEAITNVTDGHVSDDAYARVQEHFNEQEIIDLTMVAVTINGWNRLAIAFRNEAGTYRPGQYAAGK